MRAVGSLFVASSHRPACLRAGSNPPPAGRENLPELAMLTVNPHGLGMDQVDSSPQPQDMTCSDVTDVTGRSSTIEETLWAAGGCCPGIRPPNCTSYSSRESCPVDGGASPFDPSSQTTQGRGLIVGRESLVWRCVKCAGIVNSVGNDLCAGMCGTPRPSLGPLPPRHPDLCEKAIEELFDALPARDKPHVAIHYLQAIANKWTESTAALLDQCSVLVRTIRAHHERQQLGVVAVGVEVMHAMCLNSANLPILLTSGAFELLFIVMKQEEVFSSGCEVIRRIAISDSRWLPRSIVEEGIGAISCNMQAHNNNAALAMAGCFWLWRLSSDRNSKMILNAGGHLALLAALQAHPTNELLCAYACYAVQCLCLEAANAAMVVEAGAIPIVLSTLKAHTEHARIVRSCLCTLAHIPESVDHHAILSSHGGVRVVLSTMEQHIHKAAIVERGCYLLLVLATDRANLTVECISTVIACMRIHADDASVILWACGLFVSFSTGADDKLTISNLGGTDEIIAALRTHIHDSAVCTFVCRALRALSSDSVVKLGGIQAVLSAMREHVDDVDVAEHGCALLSILAMGPKHRQALADSGAIATILSAMDIHAASSAEVGSSSCCALTNLACDDDVASTISQNGGMEAIWKVIESQKATADTVNSACHAMWNVMAMARGDRCKMLHGQRGYKLLTELIELHSSHPNSVKFAYVLLLNGFSWPHATAMPPIG